MKKSPSYEEDTDPGLKAALAQDGGVVGRGDELLVPLLLLVREAGLSGAVSVLLRYACVYALVGTIVVRIADDLLDFLSMACLLTTLNVK
jgi:hypothetical protein